MDSLMSLDIDILRQNLLQCAKVAAKETLPLFRSKLKIDNKFAAGFDPVTIADKEAEKAIRNIISSQYPTHSIFGEELEDKITKSPYRWIIDPIDGTRSFISGIPLWGTLIGLIKEEKTIAGLMSQPFSDEIFLAIDGKAEYIHKGKISSLKVSNIEKLEQATLFTTTPELFRTKEQKLAFSEIRKKVKLTRYGADCYAYALLAMGQIDLIIEPNLKACDIAPLIPLIENSGGTILTWDRDSAHKGGDIIAAASRELFAAARKILQNYMD